MLYTHHQSRLTTRTHNTHSVQEVVVGYWGGNIAEVEDVLHDTNLDKQA